MEALVQGDRLQRADVILTHNKSKWPPWSWLIANLIRLFTKSYWNHGALVYVIKDRQGDADSKGYDNTFIIEAEANGIDIHNIAKYLEHPKKADLAVKRLTADWFNNDDSDPKGGLWYQRQVRGFALDSIDATYDFKRLISIGLRALWQLLHPIPEAPAPTKTPPSATSRARRGYRALKRAAQDAFVCSGFVQHAYYQAVRRAEPEDAARRENVSFNPELSGADPDDEAVIDDILLSTTPANLARSAKLAWRYLVKDGAVYEIGDGQGREVEGVLKGRGTLARGAATLSRLALMGSFLAALTFSLRRMERQAQANRNYRGLDSGEKRWQPDALRSK